MSHEIETATDGRAAFIAGNRKPAWHRLGTVLDSGVTPEEALTLGHLGSWNVHKNPMTTAEPTADGVTTLEVPGKYAVIRTNPFTKAPEVLGVVGNQYQVLQNEAMIDFLQALTDESGAFLDTAGSLQNGRKVFVTMTLPEAMTIAGTDTHALNIALFNSHDGSGSFGGLVTPTRVVCANTLSWAQTDARAKFSFRHTEGLTIVTNRVQDAREALDLVWKFTEDYAAQAERMINTQLRPTEWTKVLGKVFPLPKDATERIKKSNQREQGKVRDLYEAGDTLANVRGTRWAGFQAITEYLEWYGPVKGGDADTRRAERIMTDHHTQQLAAQAFQLLKV